MSEQQSEQAHFAAPLESVLFVSNDKLQINCSDSYYSGDEKASQFVGEFFLSFSAVPPETCFRIAEGNDCWPFGPDEPGEIPLCHLPVPAHEEEVSKFVKSRSRSFSSFLKEI